MSLCSPQHGKGPHLERPLPVLEFEHHVELSIETYGGRRPRRATCNANESRGRLEVNLATRPSHAPMRYKSARKSTKPRHSPHASAPARAPSPLAEEMPSALAEDTTPSLPRVREPPESKAVEAANRSRCRSQFTLPSDDRASPTAAAPLVTMGVRRAHLPQTRGSRWRCPMRGQPIESRGAAGAFRVRNVFLNGAASARCDRPPGAVRVAVTQVDGEAM